MDHQVLDPRSYIGRPAIELPTPSLVISEPVLRSNIDRLHEDVSVLGIKFRPHVKTLKSLEVTRLMLQDGKHRGAVASTLTEIRGLLPLVEEGLLDECLYGLPIYPSVLPQLVELRQKIKVLLMIDNSQHIELLEKFCQNSTDIVTPWEVFIKIDVGSHRAEVETHVPRLRELVRAAERSSAVSIYGFYCHAGHSYSCRTMEHAQEVLQTEVNGIVQAASLLSIEQPVVASIGATPTAHVVKSLKAALPDHITLELHAGERPYLDQYMATLGPRTNTYVPQGNFPANDLQQVSTGLVDMSKQAIRVLAEVCSVYPERNEALVNAGVIAMSRETSAFPGFGVVSDKPHWSLVRLSQEHGIVGPSESARFHEGSAERIEFDFQVGQKVYLFCQHACITAAAFSVYFVVDNDDIVKDIWIPWKFW